MPSWPLAKPAAERRVALVVVTVFLVAGSAWILFTDLLLYSVTQDPTVVARLETAKGWTFVALTALLLFVVTFRSTAHLTRTTRTMAAVVESIGDGVLLLGSDRAIAYGNPASIRMLGAAGVDDIRGMGAQEFSRRFRLSYPDGSLVSPDDFVSQRVFEESGPFRYKAVLHPPGRPEVVISCTAAGVRSEIGRPADVVVSVMHDVTATDHLDRLRDELFASAAHAIKTPVAVIKSASQVLSAGPSSDAPRATAIMERQCARIERLVDNLLALARIRSGTLQLHPTAFDLAPAVEEVASDFDRLLSGHEIRIRLNARPKVWADPERIVMTLRNVISTATRLARSGGPVSVQLDRRGHDAEIEVSYQPPPVDTTGEPDAVTRDLEDMGISRYVSAAIVEAHGGTLTDHFDGRYVTARMLLPAEFEEKT